MEKLLTAFDGVARGFESTIVQDALHRAFEASDLPTNTPALELPPEVEKKWRESYLEELDKKAGKATIFTNTHPGNVRGVYRMAAALPNSRFIFMKRDIHETCLRIYMKMYRSGNAYAYDIDNVVEYVSWYHEMIDLLVELVPGISKVFHYEDMIADPAATLKSVAKFCGIDAPKDTELPWLGDDRGCAKGYTAFIPAEA